jgi:U3 small nucleolar RNA-associated protein 12
LAPSLRNNISEFVFSPDGEWMFAHDAGRFVVSFKVLLKEEERARKKRKRDQTSTNSNVDAGADSTHANEEAALWFSLRDTLPMHKKLKHIAVSPAYKKDKDAKYFLAQAYGNNGIIVSEYSETLSSLSSAERDKTFLSSAKPLGQREAHTGEIRCSALSSNANQLVTADNASLCVWTFPSLAYIARIDWGSEQETNPLSIAICPNDRHVVVGTKEGELLLIDLHLQSIVDRVPAHSGAVWSISIAPQLAPGQSTSPTLANAVFYSGSADKTVKGWSLGTSAPIPSTSSKDSKDAAKKGSTNTKKEAEPASKAMLHEIKTYPADDAVLSVVATPRFLAVATLDNSVRLYFRDTGRFHLALYGHSLPVLSLDVSDDESLLYTASADRTLRIWGTDFGDCHRIMKAAHADSITSVAAVPRTHYFASGSKDGTVCLWDGDRFERIQTVCSGAGHVASLSFGKDGLRFVSVGGDRCIRVFEREGREIIVPSEEKEREQDAMRNEETAQQASGAGIAGATTQASAAALSRVIEAYGIAERIEGVTEKTAEDMGMNLEQALWFMVFDQKYVPGKDSERGVPPSLMDAVVGLLSSECVLRLLKMLWNVLGEESRYPVHMACVQLLLRVIQTHHASLLARSDHAILGSEEELYRVQEMLQRRKDIFGMNSAALERLRRRMDQGHAGEWNMVVDTAKEVKVHDKGSKGSSGKKGKKRSANESM